MGLKLARGTRYNSLKTLAGKVRIDELFDCAFRREAGSIDRCEINEDLAGSIAGRFIREGFRVRIQLGEICGLEWPLVVFSS